ncbi:transglycosylase domain-containing protein [Patescibacteria group bacterium]|nr:transglycosylase domain-containing protein [Patescibacteria group bacterium]
MPITQVRKKPSGRRTGYKELSVSGKKIPVQKGPGPKAKKTKSQKTKKSRRQKLFQIILVLFISGFLAIIAAYAWFSQGMVDPEKISERMVAESTKIYDRTGEHLLYETGGEVKRTYYALEDIPDNVKNATLVLEDQEFYTHPGFNWRGLARAVLKQATNQSGGGSGITQQFVKNAVVGSEHTYARKIKELIFSIRLEQKYSKDEIFEFYLNEIGYGGVNHGIGAAAQSYFGKAPGDLTLSEAATLAALPQRPTYFLNNLDDLKWRRDYALDEMVAEDYITEEEAEVAKLEDINIQEDVQDIKAPHFSLYVRGLLEEKYGSNVTSQGLKVYTTLDWDKQQKAEEAVRNGMDKVYGYGGSNAALVAIDPHTGQILAMVGSYDYFADDYDGQVNVALSARQPGSSFKPLVYATAFSKGYTDKTILFDLTTNFPVDGIDYIPHNYDNSTRGPVTMRQALATSLNIPAVKTLYLVGVDKALETADALGYTTLKDKDKYGLALVLGSGEVKLIDHTSAFATFSREGERHPPTSILKIEDQRGEVLEEWSDAPEQVFDKNAARTLNNILSDSGARGSTFSSLNLPDRPVAVKTGTTSDYRDAWTMGYTPSLTTGVWVGNNDNSEMSAGAAGLVVAAPIWKEFMTNVLAGQPVEEFQNVEEPDTDKPVLLGSIGTTETMKVDKDTGKVIPEECINSYPKEYITEKEFKTIHNILYYVIKEDPQGPYPEDTNIDPMFSSWEGAVHGLAQANPGEYVTDEPEYQDCNYRDTDPPSLSISYPQSNGKYTATTISIMVSVSADSNTELKKVDYYIDNNLVDTKTSSPWQSSYKPTSLTVGNHTLKALATDALGNTSSDTVSFEFSAQKTDDEKDKKDDKKKD